METDHYDELMADLRRRYFAAQEAQAHAMNNAMSINTGEREGGEYPDTAARLREADRRALRSYERAREQ
jgi:hypothetical protein